MYNITDFGAVPGSERLCTESIQNAINKCAENGGGRVYIPSGKFVSGTLYLKDNVEIYLENGAVLKASENMEDYNPDDAYEQNWGSVSEQWRPKHFIIAHNCENVALSGGGTIDGSGSAFFGKEMIYPDGVGWSYAWREGFVMPESKEVMRPGQLICFICCKDIRLENVTIVNAPCWTVYLYDCEYAQIRSVKIKNPYEYINTDGLDIDCCRYVTVSDCIINTGDDAIAIRCDSEMMKNPRACEYITISNCVLSAQACIFRIGVGRGEIRHVRISNIVSEHSGNVVSYCTSYTDEGCAVIEDVNFSSISAYNAGALVECDVKKGNVKNVSMCDVRANCQSGIYAKAYEGGEIDGLVFDNIDLFVEAEFNGTLSPYANNIENAKNVLLDGVRMRSNLEIWDEAFFVKDCDDIVVRNCVFPQKTK